MDYAIHAVVINKSVPKEEADKTALSILKKKKLPFMRETKNSYRYRNIPKTKFDMFRSKKVNKDTTIVFGRYKMNESLEGEGIFSDILNYGLRRGVKYAPKVISSIATAKDFNNISSKTLATFGRYPIKGLKIIRTPISGILNTALNLISLGRWNELRKKYGYDTLFHTGLVCDLGGKDIIVEKNEVVNISPEFKISKDTQTFHINMEGKQFTLEEMVMGCKTKMGDRLFFDYDAFQNNCQIFLKNMLQTVGLYTTEVDKFLFQDLSEIYKKMPSYVSRITKFITRLGGIVSRLRGDGNVAPQRMVQEPQIPEVVKCKKNTALGNCFNKGYRVGLYLANNPSLRVRKQQLEELAEELEIPLVDERGKEKTANQLREELNMCGLNIDLLDEQTNQAEEKLLENIRVRKAQNKPPLKYYRKRNRINPEPENLSLRELGFLASQYGVKGYSKMNKEQLIEALRENDYRPSSQLN